MCAESPAGPSGLAGAATRVHTEVSVARQSPQRPDADEPDAGLGEPRGVADPDEVAPEELPDEASGHLETEEAADATADRSLWEDVRIDPVEVALPSGTGFTLRAYRMSNELTPTDIGDRDLDDPFARRPVPIEDAETVLLLDEDFADQLDGEDAESRRDRRAALGRTAAEDDAEDDLDPEDLAAEDEEEEPAEEPEPEEVPIFLSHRGKLLLFKSPESLVAFVRSGAPTDMSQLDTWDQLVERIQPADVVPLDEDSYELDLVVENLRGGHDTWDSSLLIKAGEVARDLAYGVRLPSVLDMLSTGSSLDDLDEALRSTVNGGLGGFRGRRRLKKIGAQTASLGWRTIIGKISAAVDWRD